MRWPPVRRLRQLKLQITVSLPNLLPIAGKASMLRRLERATVLVINPIAVGLVTLQVLVTRWGT